MVRVGSYLILALSALGAAPALGQTRPPPINIQVAPQTERYGDWSAQQLSDTAYMATTTNDAGSLFGTLCTATSCSAIINPKIECDPGGKYPALVNTPGGSFPTSLLCEAVGEVLLYSFDLTDNLTDAMSIGGVIGLAFPMESGEFKVSRFSLTGAARATARIQQLAQGLAPSPERARVSDETTL